ncbi:hypothetical protein [Anaeromyxobacter terrae]|nr:hypothetical protein [Anaeromyxobacter sp. SG22]
MKEAEQDLEPSDEREEFTPARPVRSCSDSVREGQENQERGGHGHR